MVYTCVDSTNICYSIYLSHLIEIFILFFPEPDGKLNKAYRPNAHLLYIVNVMHYNDSII